jgi:hypothetical protein
MKKVILLVIFLISFIVGQDITLGNGIDTLNITISTNNATTYQWRLNGINIENANTYKLTLHLDNSGYNTNEYDCVVSDGFTTVYSNKYKFFLSNNNRYINKY